MGARGVTPLTAGKHLYREMEVGGEGHLVKSGFDAYSWVPLSFSSFPRSQYGAQGLGGGLIRSCDG